MAIVLVGLNHRTAPVELREKLSLAGCSLHMALEDFHRVIRDATSPREAVVGEGAIVSTCNRLEVYAQTHTARGGLAAVERFLGGLQNIAADELAPYLYRRSGEAAVTHLMRVACGLDSMILGEPQILGQVTQAFEDAHVAGTTGPVLSHLFAQAIHIGKRARTETGISRHTTSVAHVGAQKVMDELAPSQGRRVLMVGAGEMALLAAEVLARSGAAELAFINRTYGRAEAVAARMNGRAYAWHQLEEGLAWADAVVTATGAPHTVIYRHDLEGVVARRGGRRLVVVDVSVPRDVEDTVRDLPGVAYHDIDDLQCVLDAHMELRRAAVPQVEAIVREGGAQFAEWLSGRQVTPVIRNLREWAQSVAAEELEHTLSRLPGADEHTRQLVGRLTHRLVNRLLHEPTTRLRMQAADGNGYGYAHAVRELFALHELTLECPRNRAGCSATTDARGNPGGCGLDCIVPSIEGKSYERAG